VITRRFLVLQTT